MATTEPWSKKHKELTRAASGGLPFKLSNSFAEPLSMRELIDWSIARGDRDIVDEYMNHSLKYTPNGGSADLRREIAKLYVTDSITEDNIVVFAGAQVAIQTAAFSICDSTSHAIVFLPGYQSLVEGPVHARSEVTQIKLKFENKWAVDISEVEAAIKPNTRYIVMNQPQNPTGILMSEDDQKRLRDLAAANDIYVLSDEVYRLLEHDPSHRLPAICEVYNKGISIVALSKPWGGCGVTIGWAAMQDPSMRQKMIDVAYFGTACPSRGSEIQAIMTLRSSDAILGRNIDIILRNKALLTRFVEQTHSDMFEWAPPTAGAIAFLRFKGDLTTAQLGESLAEKGIGIKPAYCFAPAKHIDRSNDFFRVGFGESKFPRALDALREWAEEYRASNAIQQS